MLYHYPSPHREMFKQSTQYIYGLLQCDLQGSLFISENTIFRILSPLKQANLVVKSFFKEVCEMELFQRKVLNLYNKQCIDVNLQVESVLGKFCHVKLDFIGDVIFKGQDIFFTLCCLEFELEKLGHILLCKSSHPYVHPRSPVHTRRSFMWKPTLEKGKWYLKKNGIVDVLDDISPNEASDLKTHAENFKNFKLYRFYLTSCAGFRG